MKTRATLLLCASSLMLALASARADLSFTLPVSTMSATGSNCLAATCSLTNTDGTNNLYLNGIQVVWGGNASNLVVANTNTFFGNVPGILLPGETYQDLFLTVSLDASTPAGDYPATVTILGGCDIFATNVLASQSFDVLVGPPVLGIQQSGTNVVFAWSSPPGNFHLQTCADLGGANWTDVTNATASGTYQLQLALPIQAAAGYYRLKSP